ncbi:MAG: hpnC [Sphingomonadales bacterium]|nr:hpnC [Sphingomonadales bacterium]
MTATAAALASGKGHKSENFPVASVLLKREHRAPVMAFYRFARAADDVADNATASAEDRLTLLGAMRETLRGVSDADPQARALRETLSEHGLSTRHGLDLLTAFERDCRVDRCEDWAALIDYCRYSAMPVGRYVLDVHGESETCWPASDALCAALQIINHLQDCAKDYRAIDRVYIPLDVLAEHGATVSDLDAPVATPALRATIVDLAGRTDGLLAQSAGFAGQIRDRRLAMEVAIIHRLAVSLNTMLKTRDPLSERVHHSKPQALGLAAMAVLSQWAGR